MNEAAKEDGKVVAKWSWTNSPPNKGKERQMSEVYCINAIWFDEYDNTMDFVCSICKTEEIAREQARKKLIKWYDDHLIRFENSVITKNGKPLVREVECDDKIYYSLIREGDNEEDFQPYEGNVDMSMFDAFIDKWEVLGE